MSEMTTPEDTWAVSWLCLRVFAKFLNVVCNDEVYGSCGHLAPDQYELAVFLTKKVGVRASCMNRKTMSCKGPESHANITACDVCSS